MVKEKKKEITLTARSVVTVTDGDSAKELAIEGYSCVINSEKPEKMSVSRYYMNDEMEKVYADHRTECRADWRAFQEEAQELQDELFAMQEASEAEQTEA